MEWEACCWAGVAGWVILLLVVLKQVHYYYLSSLPVAEDSPVSGDAAEHLKVFSPGAEYLGVACSASPFCSKLEVYCRMAGIPYTRHAPDLPRAPKGKMPYIEHGSHRFGDSALIIRYLEATFFASDGRREGTVVRGAACRMERDRDADTASATWKHPKSGTVYSAGADAALAPALVPVSHLPPQDRAVGHAAMRLVEESLNQKLTAARWVEGANWHIVYNRFLGGIPEPLRCLIAPVIRRGVWADLWAKGQVRHSPADALSMTSDDLDAVESLLQAGKARWELGAAEEKHPTAYFLFGTAPCAYDAALFGMLDNFLNDGMDKPEAALVAPPALPHVHEFVKGIRSLYFSEDT